MDTVRASGLWRSLAESAPLCEFSRFILARMQRIWGMLDSAMRGRVSSAMIDASACQFFELIDDDVPAAFDVVLEREGHEQNDETHANEVRNLAYAQWDWPP